MRALPIRARLRTLWRDRSGLALLEFAFLVPILITLSLTGAELTNYITTKMRISQLALRLADDAARIGTGTPLNDHYSADFYVERRARFLGKHPDWSHIRNGLFPSANEDADLVFGDYDEDLSVQEVSSSRNRETPDTGPSAPKIPPNTSFNNQDAGAQLRAACRPCRDDPDPRCRCAAAATLVVH